MSGTAKLADFCQIVQGGRQGLSGKQFVAEGFPAYGAGGLNGNLPTYEFDKPAVILSSIGARCGKCFYVEGKWSSLANTQLIFPDPERANARFLWFQLNDERRWPRSGAAQPFIKPSNVKDHQVFLPPLDEQKRIAAVLDKADAVRRLRHKSLQLIEKLLQSVFIDMFVRNPDTANWTPRSVEWMAKGGKGAMRTGPFGSQLLHSEFVDQGIAVLGYRQRCEEPF